MKIFVNGSWADSKSTESIPLLDPATETPIGLLPAGCSEDVDLAVRAAASATFSWSSTPLSTRTELLLAAAATVTAHARELAEIECREMGRPVSLGVSAIVDGASSLVTMAQLASQYEFVRTIYSDEHTETTVTRNPVGVVAVIVPWNFSATMVLTAIAPTLVVGNTVVVKPSEKASLSVVRLFELLDFPAGVVNLVLGDARSGTALSQHPMVDLTHFTGSVEAGRAVATDAGQKLHRVILELGGKDPVIVDDGVDVAAVAAEVAMGCFMNTGQLCTSMERIYVHRAIADEFIDALAREARAFSHGDGRDPNIRMGPLVDAGQRNVVDLHVRDAITAGAQVVTGGVPDTGPGYFYPATVLTEVTDEMLIMQEETFGPIAPIQVVETFSEALERAGRSRFGLGATVYTTNRDNALAARSLPSGYLWVNKWKGNSTGAVLEPFGQSGMGAVGGFATLDALTRPSAIVETRPPAANL